MKPRKWTKAEIRSLTRWIASGTMDHARIAWYLRRTVNSVKAYCQAHGLVKRPAPTADEAETVRRMSEAGKFATEIAREIGKTPAQVYAMRRKLGLCRSPRPLGAAFESFLRQKHALGWSDTEIAAAYTARFPDRRPVDRHTVTQTRTRLGLPSVLWSEHQRRKARRKAREQCARMGIPDLSHLRLEMWRRFAIEQGWPDDLTPPYVKILNTLWAHGPLTRRQICELTGMRWKGTRASLHSNRPNGSYLADLMARNMVVVFKRAHVVAGRRRGNWNQDVYMLSPFIERKKVSHASDRSSTDATGIAAGLAGGDSPGGGGRDQVGGPAGDLRQTGGAGQGR